MFVFFMMADQKQKRRFQPKQESGLCGLAAGGTGPGGFRSWSAGAERTWVLVQKWRTHTHTHNVKLSRQATVILVEKHGNRWTAGQADHTGSRNHRPLVGLMGQCSSKHPQNQTSTAGECTRARYCVYMPVLSPSKLNLANNHSDLKQCRLKLLSPKGEGPCS